MILSLFNKIKSQFSFDPEIYDLNREKSELSVARLLKVFGKKKAVNNVSFNMYQGEIVGLLGPNGAGKTTIFYMIVGFIKPTDGNVFFNDKPIDQLAMYQRANIGISYLSQEASVFRKLTVEENVLAVLENRNLNKREMHNLKDEILEELGISGLAKQMAYSLSGGERRRTEIARALVIKPKFLLLDEPFAGIDPIAVFDIQQIIANLKEKGIGVLITDHNVRETLSITDRSYIINLGEILVSGKADELINNETARKIYLGENFTL